MRGETVVVTRSVMVELVPHGTRIELDPGMVGQITQALGGNFTLVIDGVMVRLKGEDADAIGKEPPAPAEHEVAADEDDDADLETRVWRSLSTCYDPEIPVNIVDLGLVYTCKLEPTADGRNEVHIEMTLTAPGCGMGEVMANEVADKIISLEGVADVRVDMVFDPPWDRSMMSETALLSLGL